MHKVFLYIIARAQEPTTWRGLALLITALGIAIKPDQLAAITAAGMALAGAIGAFVPDAKPVTPPATEKTP